MMKTLLTMITISISTYMVGGQVVTTSPKYCEKTLAQSPAIKGLKLGMSEQVAARLMGVTFNAYPSEPSYLRWAWRNPTNVPGFEGVRYIELITFGGKLVEIESLYYVEWNSENEFVKDFTLKLGLPADAWERLAESMSTPKNIMSCKSFNVELKMGSRDSTSLVLRDSGYREKIDDLKEQSKANMKKAVKP